MAFRGNWKLSPLIVLLTGCAANAGLAGTRTIGADPTVSSTGASVSGLLQPSRDHGFAFGGELRTSCRVNHDDDVGPGDGALRGLVGYSSAPLPHRASPVGFDALLAAGFGSLPYDGGTTRALSAGPHLGLPIGLVKGREMWDAEQKVGLTSMIVARRRRVGNINGQSGNGNVQSATSTARGRATACRGRGWSLGSHHAVGRRQPPAGRPPAPRPPR